MLVVASTLFFLGVAHATANYSSPKYPTLYPDLTSCVDAPLQYSCENTTAITNTCCSPTPGGLVLQTQFWSTYTGLEDSYNQYCDSSRNYNSSQVVQFLEDFDRWELMTYMQNFWVSQGASNPEFWAHEFSKHATCTSTFDVACYGSDYQEHQEVVNFFETVVKVFQMFPTYNMLAAFGIHPSNATTYTLAEITNALYSQTGAIPYLGCSDDGTMLDEVWYYMHVLGTEQYGHFKMVNSTTTSSCNADGIWYYEVTPTSMRPVIYGLGPA
ncbi:ribonuclease T2 [Chiua virens]|nr:ribonuclease T2 [Chiua virens]